MRLTFCWIIAEILLGSLAGAAKWGYEGHAGVDYWAELFPEACAGDHQSPIDIQADNSIYDPRLREFSIFYDPPAPDSKFVVLNNGHSIQVNTEGRFYVTNGGLHNIYSTAQFHFHWGHKSHHGSEHTIDGVPSPIEMHIVNWNSERFSSITEALTAPGGLAVLGIMFELSDHDNPILEPLVQVLMHVRDPDLKHRTEIPAVSMNSFLPPASDRYFRYNGSLTTPGCFESVVWTVFSEKQTISRRQLHVFRQVLKPSKAAQHKRHIKKRSVHSNQNMVKAVMDELGISNNAEATARFRRQLEANQETSVVVADSPAVNHTHHETTEKHAAPESAESGHHTMAPEPVTVKAKEEMGPVYDTRNDKKNMDNLRNMLVNNFRPVQPLNGRTVYRSFPFIGEPLASKTEVVYVDIDNSESRPSAGSMVSVSAVTLAFSMFVSLLKH